MLEPFSEEEIEKMVQWDQEARLREACQEAYQEAFQEQCNLYRELLIRLMPLGRAEDLLEAIENQDRLEALAREFGLSV